MDKVKEIHDEWARQIACVNHELRKLSNQVGRYDDRTFQRMVNRLENRLKIIEVRGKLQLCKLEEAALQETLRALRSQQM